MGQHAVGSEEGVSTGGPGKGRAAMTDGSNQTFTEKLYA